MRSFKLIGFFIVAVAGFFGAASLIEKEDKQLLGANQFMVITVQGQIVFQKTGDQMKRGDTYMKGVPLNFLTKEARAAIANKEDGRFVITGNKRGKVSMLPAANPISSRAGGLINIVDLKNHFEGKLAIVDRLELKIGSESFPQSEKSYFYVKYEHDGEVIPKKLAHDGDVLILDRKELYMIDGKEIPYEEKEMTLYYKGDEKTYKINKFTPVFLDGEDFKEECDLMFSSGNYDSEEEKLAAVTSLVQDFYGKPNHKNLKDWLAAKF